MNTRRLTCALIGWWLLLAAASPSGLVRQTTAAEQESPKTKIVLVAGPCDHPPGTHEAAAGARLVKHCLENAEKLPPVAVEIVYLWPEDASVLDDAATIVFIGDVFPPERFDQPPKVKADLAALMDRGCGIVCIHYATGLRAQHVTEDGDHPLLGWLGGYFAAGCPHHRSTARVCTATVTPEACEHPVLRGWREFTFDDEPYWNNYFGADGPAKNVTSLAYAMLPPDEPKKESIAWAIDRADGGRGVGIVLPHYFQNWAVDDLRTLALNAVAWTAKLDVPPEGVQTPPPDLAAFDPGSVEPKPRPQKQPAKQPSK